MEFKQNSKLFLSKIIIVLLLSMSVFGNELNEILNQFDNNQTYNSPDKAPQENKENDARLVIDGEIQLYTSYSYSHPSNMEPDYAKLSHIKSRLDLNADINFNQNWKGKLEGYAFYDAIYNIKGQDQYPQDVLDDYEKEAELENVYIKGALTTNLDLKIGRQLVRWGKSDNLVVTDILNPYDLREPGTFDLDEFKLPVTMTKFDYYFNAWNLSLIAINEVRFDKEPPIGSEYNPLSLYSVPIHTVNISDNKPSSNLENTQWAASVQHSSHNFDFSLYYADVFDKKGTLENNGTLQREYDRIFMFGGDISLVVDKWILFAETAYFSDMKYNNISGSNIEISESDRLDILGGIEYHGFEDVLITFEALDRHLLDYKQGMLDAYFQEIKKNQIEYAFRLDADFLHQTLHFHYFTKYFGKKGEEGGVHRGWIKYDVTDSFDITLGIINYIGGDNNYIEAIKDNDRVYTVLKYRF